MDLKVRITQNIMFQKETKSCIFKWISRLESHKKYNLSDWQLYTCFVNTPPHQTKKQKKKKEKKGRYSLELTIYSEHENVPKYTSF